MCLLTVRQAAERLAVSPTTVRALIARGELAAVRVARCVRVSEAAMGAYLARSSIEPAVPSGMDRPARFASLADSFTST